VETTVSNRVRIVDGFDWTVTANEDVHIISKVRDLDNNVTKNLHTYKPAGSEDFITSEDFTGGTALYTSGTSVFLIGLNGGRVFVEKAEGGTNNFVKVYEATSGRRFDHGVVHIENGKAYYYLMEDSSGSAQPLYLQVIDLDVEPVDPTLANNLTIQSIGETCVDKNNGKLVINAAAASDYVATINNVDYSFTKRTTIEDLKPGTYNLCIDVVGQDYTSCHELIVEAAETLSAKIEVSKKTAAISVTSGTAPYTVLKNGEEVLKTNQKNFSVSVNDGDSIQVKSKEACQGEMLKTINLLENIKAYPNPSNGLFELFIPNDINNISVEVYNIQSRLLDSRNYSVVGGKVQLNLQDKPNGVYFVKVNSKKPVFVKVIKK
jgi:hypothetical protein